MKVYVIAFLDALSLYIKMPNLSYISKDKLTWGKFSMTRVLGGTGSDRWTRLLYLALRVSVLMGLLKLRVTWKFTKTVCHIYLWFILMALTVTQDCIVLNGRMVNE
jgi:hypothetical protein